MPMPMPYPALPAPRSYPNETASLYLDLMGNAETRPSWLAQISNGQFVLQGPQPLLKGANDEVSSSRGAAPLLGGAGVGSARS